jgi:hypothetical protein
MKRAWLCLAALVVAASLTLAQGLTKKAEAPKPIAVLGWLVGGVWTAGPTELGPGLQRIETRYLWSETNTFLRFNTHFVADKGTVRTYDGNLFWNPAQKTLAMWYMNGDNEIIEGPMQVEGDDWNMTFSTSDGGGKMADYRVDITRKTNDHYHWSLQQKEGDVWKEILALEFLRVVRS